MKGKKKSEPSQIVITTILYVIVAYCVHTLLYPTLSYLPASPTLHCLIKPHPVQTVNREIEWMTERKLSISSSFRRKCERIQWNDKESRFKDPHTQNTKKHSILLCARIYLGRVKRNETQRN